MAVTKSRSTEQIERHLVAIAAAQRMAGEEPTAEDMEAARRVLAGEATADEVIVERFEQIDRKYGIVRQPQ
ncbi:MAG: hypothetical protein QM711_14490 [Micropruina sp.]|uniref:hypothetical protein n=1 Tax=Micropruina sp. TaxID=2737536 RepID=UPI0039E6E8FB